MLNTFQFHPKQAVRLALLTAGIMWALSFNSLSAFAAQKTTEKFDLSPNGYTWKRKHRQGDTYRAKSHVSISVNLEAGIGFLVDIHETEKTVVSRVKPDGTVILVTTTEKYEETVEGEPQEAPEDINEPHKEILSSKGEVISKESSKNENLDSLEAVHDMVEYDPIPDKPVHVGDSWTNEIDNKLLTGQKVTIKATLKGVIHKNNRTILILHKTTQFPIHENTPEDLQVKYDGTTMLDLSNGLPISSEELIQNAEIAIPEKLEVGAKAQITVQVASTITDITKSAKSSKQSRGSRRKRRG